MTRGRKPKPIERHNAEGTRRSDRHGDGVLDSLEEPPRMPSHHFSEDAKEMWENLRFVMSCHGTWSRDYELVIIQICEAYADYQKARHEFYEEHGGSFVLKDEKGNPKANPAARSSSQLRDQFVKLLEKVGLTPTERARMNQSAGNDFSSWNDNDPNQII